MAAPPVPTAWARLTCARASSANFFEGLWYFAICCFRAYSPVVFDSGFSQSASRHLELLIAPVSSVR
jgi:hypothetical protein